MATYWVPDLSIIKDFSILVPIALFASLSWRGLGTRNEGLWGHQDFQINLHFFDWLFENKEILNRVIMFVRIAAAKISNSCDQPCLKMENMEYLGENSPKK